MSVEVLMVLVHLFLENLSIQCECGHFLATFTEYAASLSYTFHIGYT